MRSEENAQRWSWSVPLRDTLEEGSMLRLGRIAATILVLAISAPLACLAAGQTIGAAYVVEVRDFTGPARSVVTVTFASDATIEVPPVACATSGEGLSYAFDLGTSQGRAAYQLAQAALVTGLTQRIFGTGQCTLVAGIENGLGILLFAP